MALINPPAAPDESPASALDFSSSTRVLLLSPHPDDETIANGLLIQQVKAAGGAVRIVLLTQGDNNPWPQRWLERRLWIGKAGRQRWGARRWAEMGEALHELGLSLHDVVAMGWPDMGLTDRLLQCPHEVIGSLAAAIDDFGPNLLISPCLGDRHPDHGAAYVMTRLASASARTPARQLAYLVHGSTQGGACVPIVGTVRQQECKQRALSAYRSQLALSGGRLRRMSSRPERYFDASTGSASPSVLPWSPPTWLQPWLRLHVVQNDSSWSWRWADAPLQRDERGGFRLLMPMPSKGVTRFAKMVWNLHTFWIFDHWGWREI